MSENQGQRQGNIAGTASRACGPVGTGRWHEAGSPALQVGVVHKITSLWATVTSPFANESGNRERWHVSSSYAAHHR